MLFVCLFGIGILQLVTCHGNQFTVHFKFYLVVKIWMFFDEMWT